VAGLVRLWLERHDDRPIVVRSAREHLPDHTVSHFLKIEDKSTPVAHVIAVADIGEPSVHLVDSYSTVTHVPWVLLTAQALTTGAKPPTPRGLELTRATVSIEHTFFGEWGSSQVGAAAGEPALMGRFVQFGRTEGSEQERPLEFARLVYRADSAQLAFDLS
jgi:DNA-binding GntR family transcriptional regulator